MSQSKLPDVVDYYITSGLRRIPYHISNLLDLSSDQSPVLLSFYIDPNNYITSLTFSLIQDPVDWGSFQKSLDNYIELNIPLKMHNDIDNAVNNAILTASKPRQTRNLKKSHELPTNIQKLLGQKRRTRRTWQNWRYTSEKK